MSKMVRAHSREMPMMFKKTCGTYSTHFAKTNDDFDDGDEMVSSSNFPLAYTKKLLAVSFMSSCRPPCTVQSNLELLLLESYVRFSLPH